MLPERRHDSSCHGAMKRPYGWWSTLSSVRLRHPLGILPLIDRPRSSRSAPRRPATARTGNLRHRHLRRERRASRGCSWCRLTVFQPRMHPGAIGEAACGVPTVARVGSLASIVAAGRPWRLFSPNDPSNACHSEPPVAIVRGGWVICLVIVFTARPKPTRCCREYA